jgi:hypothetical protein
MVFYSDTTLNVKINSKQSGNFKGQLRGKWIFNCKHFLQINNLAMKKLRLILNLHLDLYVLQKLKDHGKQNLFLKFHQLRRFQNFSLNYFTFKYIITSKIRFKFYNLFLCSR